MGICSLISDNLAEPPAPRQPENTRPPVRATPLLFPGDGAQLTNFATPQVTPVIPPAPAQPTQPQPFAGGGFPPQQPEPQAAPQPQFVPPQPQPPIQAPLQQQERANSQADIARVLQPLPPPNPAVFGPPALQQPFPPLANPLPTPPRDLYELSPYNTLLNLPQTTALLTAAYSQQNGIPPPSYGRRSGNRTGGLLRALTGRGRKEEDVRFVPVFINGQPAPQQPAAGAPAPPAAVDPSAGAASSRPFVTLHDPPVPRFPTPQPGMDGPPTARPPIRFSSATPQYLPFLNYSHHPIMYNDVRYPTAMHLHEALKYLPTNPAFAEHIRRCPDVGQVHALSMQLESQAPNSVRSDWLAVYLQSVRFFVCL